MRNHGVTFEEEKEEEDEKDEKEDEKGALEPAVYIGGSHTSTNPHRVGVRLRFCNLNVSQHQSQKNAQRSKIEWHERNKGGFSQSEAASTGCGANKDAARTSNTNWLLSARTPFPTSL